MVRVGLSAPRFDCQTVVKGNLVQCRWHQVHENKRLVLLFDSLARATHSREHLIALSNAVEQLRGLPAKLAVVCRDRVKEVLTWANRPSREGGPGNLAFPLIVDSDDRVAWLYDLLQADGKMLWGQFLIDSHGIVRQMAVSCFPFDASVEALVQSVEASRFQAGRGPWN